MHGEVFAWFEGKTAKENLKPKELTYDMLTLSIIVMYMLCLLYTSDAADE